VTLAPQESDLWAQFEALRPLAEQHRITSLFDGAIVHRDARSMKVLYEHAMVEDSDAARALADAAEWMNDWAVESLSASVSHRRAAHYIAEAAKQVKL
jgi:hypothetical protein